MPDHLAVLQDVALARDFGNADLVAEGHVLQQPDGAGALALQRDFVAGAGGIDQGGGVIGRMKNDASWHL